MTFDALKQHDKILSTKAPRGNTRLLMPSFLASCPIAFTFGRHLSRNIHKALTSDVIGM